MLLELLQYFYDDRSALRNDLYTAEKAKHKTHSALDDRWVILTMYTLRRRPISKIGQRSRSQIFRNKGKGVILLTNIKT